MELLEALDTEVALEGSDEKGLALEAILLDELLDSKAKELDRLEMLLDDRDISEEETMELTDTLLLSEDVLAMVEEALLFESELLLLHAPRKNIRNGAKIRSIRKSFLLMMMGIIYLLITYRRVNLEKVFHGSMCQIVL